MTTSSWSRAVAAGPTVIVTGDDDLLELGTYAGIAIVSPRRLPEMLDSGKQAPGAGSPHLEPVARHSCGNCPAT
jgi:hypothetical protein